MLLCTQGTGPSRIAEIPQADVQRKARKNRLKIPFVGFGRGRTLPRNTAQTVGRVAGLTLAVMLALTFLNPVSAQATQTTPNDSIQHVVRSDAPRPLTEAERQQHARLLPGTDSRAFPYRSTFDDIKTYMEARVRQEVTPLARIVSANGRYQEILPTKANGNDHTIIRLSGLGKDRIWAAYGLASTSAGQDRHGLTARQNAHHYADIDDYTFLIRKKDSGEFVTAGTIPGIDPETGVGQLVAAVPMMVELPGAGEYEIVFNPFPKGLSDAEIEARLGYLCWRDGGTTTTGVDFPPHASNQHRHAVSPFGFPMGRKIVVEYDGT